MDVAERDIGGATQPFLVRHTDVFLLDGPEVSASGLRLGKVERAEGARPVLIGLAWHQGDSGGVPTCDVRLDPISERRWRQGDGVDATIRIEAPEGLRAGGVLDVRLPIQPDALGDRRFGTVFALSYRLDRPEAVGGAQLCLMDGGGHHIAWNIPVGPVVHAARATRVMVPLGDPGLVLRLHLNAFEGAVTLRVARAFVGQEYDPFRFNPYFERMAALGGLPDLGRVAEAKAEFLRKAQEAMLLNEYCGEQCFLKPIIVTRGTRPTFPLLIGTPNSLSWYGQGTSHNLEFFRDDGFVRQNDVVLDCGAHAGEVAMALAGSVGPRGRVIAFDPFPQNHLQVEAQAVLNAAPWLTSVCAGLGPSHATVPTELELQQTFGPDGHSQSRSSFPLKIVPLDDYRDAAPNFVKIDIEGAEAGCLEGAQKMLRQRKPRLFIEVHPMFLPNFNHSVQDLFDLIPRDIYRVTYTTPGAPPGWHEYDGGAAKRFEGQVGGLVRADPR